MAAAGPYEAGETASVYKLCQLFKSNPELHYRSIVIHENGKIEIAADATNGQVRNWARALPNHRETVGLAPTHYGSTEAVVLTEDQIAVTIRPLFGGVS
jgi:hypothetical protein